MESFLHKAAASTRRQRFYR